jgi:hypothetical protein
MTARLGDSPPPCGGGSGVGVGGFGTSMLHGTTPRPNPPPQSKSAVADFDRSIEWPKPAYPPFQRGREPARREAAFDNASGPS